MTIDDLVSRGSVCLTSSPKLFSSIKIMLWNITPMRAITWIKLENPKVSEGSQTQRTARCMLSFIWQIHRQRADKWLPGAGKGWESRMMVMAKECGVSFWSAENVLKLLWWWLHASEYKSTKSHWTAHCKWLNSMMCELYHNQLFLLKGKKKHSTPPVAILYHSRPPLKYLATIFLSPFPLSPATLTST